MTDLAAFRAETRAWLAQNCPPGARGPGEIHTGSTKVEVQNPDVQLWLERMAERGWTVPTWPVAYGGGGLSNDEARVLYQEMAAIDARPPLVNMGTRMLGPTLLEYGTEAQKQRHLTRIARGGAAWCQGYSEPGAGSDLASLRTRAEDRGDHFVINGQKIWTSGAQNADWMFCLVRTDPGAPKHRGISFVLLPMDQEGVTVRPIQLISGSSPFCETFLDNAVARKEDLVGPLNDGWTVGKRLLQHERSGQGGLGPSAARPRPVGVTVDLEVDEVARAYLGEVRGRIAEPALRAEVTRWRMNSAAYALTQRRAGEENTSGGTPGEATSIFKLYGSTLARERQDLLVRLMGTRGLGWEGDGFTPDELGATRSWLASKAVTIYGGTNEVQSNIIAKRVLGLPD
ncbi:MAG: acyl-CoA dehydrogenase family protein [Pseudomonadales bacterium]